MSEPVGDSGRARASAVPVLPAVVIPVDDATRVGEARRAAAAVATAIGFGEIEAGRVALVATELATNLARHAVGGQFVVQAMDGPAVDLLAVDRGPGILDVGRAMVDGYSSGGTSGAGLGAVRRQADAIDVYSRPAPYEGILDASAQSPTGAGTVVWARCAAATATGAAITPPLPRLADVGGVCVPMDGERVSGDAWAVAGEGGRVLVLVVDGLGHGPAAAAAADEAVATFRAHAAGLPPAALVERLHAALRATRGAAVAVAEFDAWRREIRFAGVGNVAGTVITAAAGGGRTSHGMMSHNGTVGHQLRKVQEIAYAWPVGALAIFHTDGIRTRWELEQYPGLASRRPAVIAAVLWRDYARGRDDATVVAVRDAAAAGGAVTERSGGPS